MVAIIGALAYAELGQQQPQAGGPYVYLRDAWHPMAGFMYGWATPDDRSGRDGRMGVALLALGIPVYYWSKRQARAVPPPDASTS